MLPSFAVVMTSLQHYARPRYWALFLSRTSHASKVTLKPTKALRMSLLSSIGYYHKGIREFIGHDGFQIISFTVSRLLLYLFEFIMLIYTAPTYSHFIWMLSRCMIEELPQYYILNTNHQVSKSISLTSSPLIGHSFLPLLSEHSKTKAR